MPIGDDDHVEGWWGITSPTTPRSSRPASPPPERPHSDCYPTCHGCSRCTVAAARLDRLPVGRWHWKLTVLVGIGAFYEYYEVFLGGVLAAVLGPLWQLNSFETASLIASVFLGMFFGALTLGRLADRIGRRRMFLINLTIYLFFSLVAAFAPNLWVLVACRFIAGIGAGAEAALIPAYLAEFIPPKRRGRHIGYAFTMAFLAYPVITLIGAPLRGVTSSSTGGAGCW